MEKDDWGNQHDQRVWQARQGISTGTAIIIAAVIITATPLVFIAGEQVLAWYAVKQISESFDGIAQSAQVQTAKQIEAIQRQEAARQAAARAEQQRRDEAQRQIWAAQIAEREAAAQRETARKIAWEQFYKPYGPQCDNPPTDTYLKECVNSRMRQSAAFNTQWASR